MFAKIIPVSDLVHTEQNRTLTEHVCKLLPFRHKSYTCMINGWMVGINTLYGLFCRTTPDSSNKRKQCAQKSYMCMIYCTTNKKAHTNNNFYILRTLKHRTWRRFVAHNNQPSYLFMIRKPNDHTRRVAFVHNQYPHKNVGHMGNKMI